METEDRFDLPVNSACAEAGVDYVAAVDLLLSEDTGSKNKGDPTSRTPRGTRW
jgi:hypothetical protein